MENSLRVSINEIEANLVASPFRVLTNPRMELWWLVLMIDCVDILIFFINYENFMNYTHVKY